MKPCYSACPAKTLPGTLAVNGANVSTAQRVATVIQRGARTYVAPSGAPEPQVSALVVNGYLTSNGATTARLSGKKVSALTLSTSTIYAPLTCAETVAAEATGGKATFDQVKATRLTCETMRAGGPFGACVTMRAGGPFGACETMRAGGTLEEMEGTFWVHASSSVKLTCGDQHLEAFGKRQGNISGLIKVNAGESLVLRGPGTARIIRIV